MVIVPNSVLCSKEHSRSHLHSGVLSLNLLYPGLFPIFASYDLDPFKRYFCRMTHSLGILVCPRNWVQLLRRGAGGPQPRCRVLRRAQTPMAWMMWHLGFPHQGVTIIPFMTRQWWGGSPCRPQYSSKDSPTGDSCPKAGPSDGCQVRVLLTPSLLHLPAGIICPFVFPVLQRTKEKSKPVKYLALRSNGRWETELTFSFFNFLIYFIIIIF